MPVLSMRARQLALAPGAWLLLTLLALLSCGGRGQSNTMLQRAGDVLASGSAAHVADSVAGDAMLAGSEITFSGATGGDYLGAGGKQTIQGRIHGSLRAAGGEVHVGATVDRNATIAGGQLTLEQTALVARNAYLAGGNLTMNGTVRQGLSMSGGTAVINGTVGGNVEVSASELRIGPNAQILGNLRYRVAPQRVHIDPAAQIRGMVTPLPPHRWGNFGHVFRFLWLLGFLVAGLVVVALAPRFATRAATLVQERPGKSALVGILWLILLPIAAMLVAVTVIGLPLALIAGGIYLLLLCFGRFALALWLGRVIAGRRTGSGRQGALLNFLLGGIILVILSLIPLLGALVMIVTTIVGVGALLLALRALRDLWMSEPA